MIRRWARIGLIRPVRRVCRLPYFDFREVASAQRLAKLLDEGVRSDVLEASLAELSQTLVGTDRSLAQLNLLVQDEQVVLRDSHGVLNPRTGQRLLDFDAHPELNVIRHDGSTASAETHASSVHPLASVPVDTNDEDSDDEDSDDVDSFPVSFSIVEARLRQEDRGMNDWSAGDWFHEGCRLAEENAFDSAENAFRNCLTLLATDHSMLRETPGLPDSSAYDGFPDPADVQFHLADVLYRAGKVEAAIERYHCAIEFAPDFIEAWTQLGCLQTERGYWLPAEEALLTAISIHDSNPDALLHYAQLLEQMKRNTEALDWWRKYLRYDSRGPWADYARRRLEEAADGSGSQAAE
jgi:DNA-binding transcriptional MerR regulator